jgi:HPt (histidine-containing phosphotransfer) domain-containing protein
MSKLFDTPSNAIVTLEGILTGELEAFMRDLEEEGVNRAEVCELLQIFRQSTPPLIADLQSAIEAKDSAEAWGFAHTLKGSCSSMGFEIIANALVPVGSCCRDQDWPNAWAAMEAVTAAYQQAAELCRAIIETQVKPAPLAPDAGTPGLRELGIHISAETC